MYRFNITTCIIICCIFSETQADNARALLTKDALPVPGQFDDAVENGKSMEKGQGDAPLVTAVALEN